VKNKTNTSRIRNMSNMSHNIMMHTSGMHVEFERLMSETSAQLVGWLPPIWVVPILHHDQLLRAVVTSPYDLNETTIAPPKDYHNTTQHNTTQYKLLVCIDWPR
jgi:hypothetical protein